MIALLFSLASPPAFAEPEAATDAPQVSEGGTSPPTADAPLAIDPADLLGSPSGPPLTGEALKQRTHEAAKLLRCPVCQGTSVADSPSEAALAMKKQVEDLAAQGYDTEQILTYFEASYGEFIRLEPKTQGVTLLVWALPVLLVLGGGGVIAWMAGGRKPPTPKVTAPTPTVDPELEPWLRRVREETR